jgi:hypothetical protein
MAGKVDFNRLAWQTPLRAVSPSTYSVALAESEWDVTPVVLPDKDRFVPVVVIVEDEVATKGSPVRGLTDMLFFL